MKIIAPLMVVLALVTGSLWYGGAWTYFKSVMGSFNSPSPNSAKTEDRRLRSSKPAAGRAIVIHGLNFDADGMLPLGEMLSRDFGYDALVVRMAGHRGNLEETFKDPLPIWRDQFRSWQQSHPAPWLCVGYSMGGLLLLEGHRRGDFECSAFLLFAPALALRTPDWMIRAARAVTPSRLKIPSGIPQNYKHFDFLGLAPTFALFTLIESFRSTLVESKKVPPGLLVIDLKDQVIDAKGVLRIVEKHMPNWNTYKVNSIDLPEHHAFHLLVDEKHLGREQWIELQRRVQDLLNSVNSNSGNASTN